MAMIWTTIDGVPAAAILGRGEPYTLWRTSTIGGGHGHVWPYEARKGPGGRRGRAKRHAALAHAGDGQWPEDTLPKRLRPAYYAACR